MPVPTYSRIDDSEIDPESPITTSLMTRLRDNFLAIMGIDTTATAPSFTLPASYMAAVRHAAQRMDFDDDTSHAGAEITLTQHSDPSELIVIGRASGTSLINSDEYAEFNIDSINVVYSAGSPTGVRFTGFVHSTHVPVTAYDVFTPFDVTLTLTNTWQTVVEDYPTNSRLQAKLRADSTYTYLTLRTDVDNVGTCSGTFYFSLTIKRFQSKV